MLNTAISKGKDWTISKELELDGYIISAAYSTDHKSTLAVFEPAGNGNYEFSTSTNRDHEEAVIGGTAINEKWYDVMRFIGAKTEYTSYEFWHSL